MSAVGVPGLATKNFDRGTEVPASEPPAHDDPDESRLTAGTKTL